VSEAEVEIETVKGKGKKAVTELHAVPFSTIKTTKVQIKF
jgi:hypothetical protein